MNDGNLAQLASIAERKLVRREQHVELGLLGVPIHKKFVLADDLPGSFISVVHDVVHIRSPVVEGVSPCGHC